MLAHSERSGAKRLSAVGQKVSGLRGVPRLYGYYFSGHNHEVHTWGL